MRRFHLRAGLLALPFRVLVLAALVLVMFTSVMQAAEEERFFLNADGSVEKRLASQEKKTADLEKRIADLEAKLSTKASVGPVNPNWKPDASKAAAAPSKVTFSVCSNGKCYVYEQDASVPLPLGAKVLSVSSPATANSVAADDTGPCACGANCQCVASFALATAPMSTTATSYASDSGSERWYLGKNLGRNRAGRGCSSCGQ